MYCIGGVQYIFCCWKSAILKHTYPVKTNFSKHEQISHLAVAWIWPSVKGYSVQCVKPPCFSSQASQSHNFKPSIMQGWLGLTRILKSCVGHRNVFYSTSTHKSVPEFYRQNGFIDQVSSSIEEGNWILIGNRQDKVQHIRASVHQVPVVQPEGLAPVKALLEKLEQENGGRLPGQLSRWGFPFFPLLRALLLPANICSILSWPPSPCQHHFLIQFRPFSARIWYRVGFRQIQI